MNFVYFLQVMLIMVKLVGLAPGLSWFIVLSPIFCLLAFRILSENGFVKINLLSVRSKNSLLGFIAYAVKQIVKYNASIEMKTDIFRAMDGYRFKSVATMKYEEKKPPFFMVRQAYSFEGREAFPSAADAEKAALETREKFLEIFDRTFRELGMPTKRIEKQSRV